MRRQGHDIIIPAFHHSSTVRVCRICHRHEQNTYNRWRAVVFLWTLFFFPSSTFPTFSHLSKFIIAKLHVNRWNRQKQWHVSEQQQLSSTVCSVGNQTPSLKRRSSTPVTGRRGCNGHIVLYIVFYMCFKDTSPDDWGPENEQYMSNLMCREMHRYVSKARFMTLRGYCLVTAADERFVSVFRKARNWWYSTPVCHRALGFRCVSTSVVTP